MVTIKEIASLAGVSIGTVSRVINGISEGVGEETQQKVLRVISENNYRPNKLAKSMVTKRTHTIGLLLPDVSNPFFAEIAKSLGIAAARRGYQVFLCNTNESLQKEIQYIQALTDQQVEGIVLIPSTRQKRLSQSD